MSSSVRSLATLAGLLALPALASAQYSSDFEALTASATGTVLTGQDGYYVPAGIDFNAFTYAGNSLGIAANPNGGANFVAGTGPAGGVFARAQRDVTYGSGDGTWTIGYDILATFSGVLPTAQNVGSVSIQPFPGSQSCIALATWSDVNTATNWNAGYVWYDGAGAQLNEAVANPGFQNLAVNTWYRWETKFSLDTNQILEVRITDIAAGTTASNNPVDRYLEGGTAGSATPTGFRFFAGGGVDGNTLAFDNPLIQQEGYKTGFEGVSASAAGTVLTGQDGYYLPAGTNSVDFNAYSYAGNALGVPANPYGGANFIAADGPGSPTFGRAQRDIGWGSGSWTVGFDILAQYNGALPTAQNVGSISTQPSAANQGFIALARWTDVATAATWDADYVWFDATGASLTESVPDPGFQNLAVNGWYRWETDIDLTTNQITEVRLIDLATGNKSTHQPADRWGRGGSAGAPAATAFRFFAGGGVPGNTLAFDNPSICPASSAVGSAICSPAVANSTGGPASLTATGSDSAADNDVRLCVVDLPAQSMGYFLVSQELNTISNPGGSMGDICIASYAIGRYDSHVRNSGASGSVVMKLDLTNTPFQPGGPISIGAGAWYWQYWYRDMTTGGTATSNFSDAVCIVFS